MGDLAKKLGLELVEPAPAPPSNLAATLGLEVVEGEPDPAAAAAAAAVAEVPRARVTPAELTSYEMDTTVLPGDMPRRTGRGIDAPIAKPPEVSKAESVGYGALNTASFGGDDEGAGLFSMVAGEVPRTVGRGVDAPLDTRSDYEIGRDRARDAHADAEAANPKTYMAGQVLGALPTAILPASSGATAGVRALQTLETAVPAGLAYGALDSDAEKPVDVAFDAIAGGEGAALVAPALNEVIHRGITRIAPLVKDFVLGRGAKEKALRTAYGPRINDAIAANANTPQGMDLRALARRGADPGAIEAHTEEIRKGLEELAGDSKQALRAADPKAHEEYAATIRRELEGLWPERETALRGVDDKVIEQHARDVQEKVSAIWRSSDVVKWTEDIGSKGPLVAKLLKRDGVDPAAVITEADRVAGNLEQTLLALQEYVSPNTPDGNFLTKLAKEVKEYQYGTPSMAKRQYTTAYDDAGDKFLRLDQVKREFQKALSSARERRDSPIIAELEQVEEMLRNHLERADVWGKGAGALQEARNRGWRDRLLLNSKNADPRRLFLSDASGKASADPYKPMLEGDPAGITKILKNIDEHTSSNELLALQRWADREASLAEALSDHIDPDPAMRAAARAARKSAKELQDVLAVRMREAKAARGMKAAGPALAQDPEKLLSLVRNADGFTTSDDLNALRAWLAEQADQPYAGAAHRKAVETIEGALAQRAADLKAAPMLDEPGHILSRDRSKLLGLVKGADDYTRTPELQELRTWINNKASQPGATDRVKELAAALNERLDARSREAVAARTLAGVGSPTELPAGGARKMARAGRYVPVLSDAAEKIAETTPVPDLGKNAETLQRLEQALGLGNDPHVREALKRVFGQLEGSMRTPRPAGPRRGYALPSAEPAARGINEVRRESDQRNR